MTRMQLEVDSGADGWISRITSESLVALTNMDSSDEGSCVVVTGC